MFSSLQGLLESQRNSIYLNWSACIYQLFTFYVNLSDGGTELQYCAKVIQTEFVKIHPLNKDKRV